MYEMLPPDVTRLRVLEEYLRLQLEQVQAAIARLEQRPAAVPSKPSPPPWLAEYEISAQHRLLQIHTGDCTMKGQRTRPITEQEARQGCVDVGACQFRRPDTVLGVLD